MKKRLFSILLSICMVLTMIPMAGGGVFAQTTKTTEHKHCVCGAVHKTIGDHTAEDADASKTFQAWESDNKLPDKEGRYYLTKDVVISETWQPADGTVLCLNGKTITGAENKNVIKISGEFTLTDCAEVCGSITGGRCGVYVNDGKTFNMYNGLIKGNGRGVFSAGYFNMYGGSIIKNISTSSEIGQPNISNGAGVYILGGMFAISGNVQITGNLKYLEGDKRYVDRNVYAYNSNSKIKITVGEGGLGEDAHIGLVYDGSASDIVNANETDYSSYFTVDNALGRLSEVRRNSTTKKLYFGALQTQDGFNFDCETEVKSYGDNNFTKTANGDDITYSSHNTSVAKVSKTTGAVTVVGAGTAIIKAIKENSDSNQRNYYTYYTLTVNKRAIVIPKDIAETYNGQEQKCYEDNDEYNRYVTFIGDMRTEANETGYEVTAVLKDKENTQWSDDTTDNKTFKFKINKVDGSMVAPAAVNNLVYNGSEQSLVTAGSGTGTMKYSLDGTNYSTTVPKGKEAKPYTVHYKVEGDSNHKDTAAASINVEVKKAAVTVTADNKTINTGGTLPANSYTAEGLFGSDTLGDATYTYKDAEGKVVAADAINLNKAGTYTIEVSGLSNNNYEITYATGTLTINKKFSGSTYKPPVQKPSIAAGEGFKAELSSDGTKATITVEEGYEIVDVLVNGISKGKVTEITGLKTGDTIEVKTEKKQTEPVKPADNKHIIRGVKNTEIELEITVNKDGNIVIKWKKSKGYRVDGFEILRAVKKNGKYSKIYTTKSGKASRIVNAKNLKDGKRYYYKVRGVRTIDGKKYYTEWSDIESEKVNK